MKANRKMVRLKGNALACSVAGTELATLGTANDVLARLPFVNTDGEEISVMGKGKPAVFIDNRPMRDESELTLLKSERIKDVQIIYAPGAEYGAEVKAVIKIQTKQTFAQGFSGKLTSQTTRKRVWEEKAMADLSYNWTHAQVFGQFVYNNSGSRNRLENTTRFVYDNAESQLSNAATVRNKSAAVIAKGGFVWNNQGQSAGAYYQYTNTPTHLRNRGTETDRIGLLPADTLSKQIAVDARQEKHLASVYYDNTFASGAVLHFDGNYLHTRYTDDNLTETLSAAGTDGERVPSKTKTRADFLAAKLYYEFPAWTGKLNVGAEGSYTFNHQQYTMLSAAVSTYIPSTVNESRQQDYAAFATFSKEWAAFSFQAGLRWETVKFDYEKNHVRDTEVSKTDHSLSPHLSLTYRIGSEVSMALDYSHSIVRPPYKQLRSSLLYVGPYEVEGGNPALGHCKTHTLDYLLSWRDVTLEVTYAHQADTYVYTKEHYAADSPILIFSPRQADIDNLSAYLSYAPTVKWWKPNLTVGLDKQWLTLYGARYGRPVFRYMLKNVFIPSKAWLLTLDVTGSTRGHVMTNEMRSSWGVDLGVRRFFLQKRLQVGLAATDIFHTRSQSWVMNVQDVRLHKVVDADTRRVTLTLSYTFNPKKSRYKGQTANGVEMKRL